MPSDPDTRLRFIVVGCGRIAPSHLDAIASLANDATLVATVDADSDRAAALATRYGAAHSFTDLADALALPGVDAVLIASPNSLHAAQTLQCLAAGKHVLVEKPMAENATDAREAAEAARLAGKVLSVGHTFRHNAAVRHLQDHWADFGRLRAVEISQCFFWDGPQAPWWATRPAAEGLILSLYAPHPLDFVQLVMGQDEPSRVQVEAARHQTGWLGEDEAMILLGYPGRRMVSIHISYNQRQVTDRKTLFFDLGVMRIEDGEFLYWNDELLVRPDPATITDARSMGGRDLSGYFRTQLQEFIHAVRGQPHRSPLGNDGARLIALIDRIKAAARATCADDIDGPPGQ
ncbi:MAG: Gfo/Idh/MocA family oxidoreductase [Azospirillaceae bacterium]|nr:Gfo/Idh/MocA family oxidoreductase [Azospirillaceae bacterium]